MNNLLLSQPGLLQVKSPSAVAESKTLHHVSPFEIKAVDEEARTFEGLASTWEQDLGGDVIEPGAFKRTLKNWKRSKRALPLIDSHNYYSVRSVFGKLIEAEETDAGLLAKFDVIEGPDGDEVFRRIKGGYVDGLSIGYRAVKVRYPEKEEERKEGVWRYLEEVKLIEVSVVIFGMNEGALIDTSTVKAMIMAAKGRDLLEEEREELKRIHEHIGALLEAKAPTTDDSPTGQQDASEGEDPPVVDPEAEGLAPDDPKRVQLEESLRDLQILSLGTV